MAAESNRKIEKIRLILGDQLNPRHYWFKEKDDSVLYTLMEIKPEATYIKHHIQKLLGFFGGMRNFAENLRKEGHQVKYFKLDDKNNQHDFGKNIKHLLTDYPQVQKVEYQYPDEYRLDQTLSKLNNALDLEVEAVDSKHFICERNHLEEFFKGKKQYLLESFYRDLRKSSGILMNKGKPVGEKWNFDQSNRKSLPKNIDLPKEQLFQHDLSEIKASIDEKGWPCFGEVDAKKFTWPLNREEALELLDYFLKNLFSKFGDYQDALTTRHYSLFHSRLSFALNTKMLNPLEVCQKAEDYWKAHQDTIDISQAEGFIRQILGWREYMRGVYWAKMPEYRTLNFFKHKRSLPEFYWTGKTKMKCLSHSITQSLETAYAHHIQRLMITGNFALLAGIDPDEVDAWYLGIYMDALEWVEITNTRGMSQFADGGIVGTKPYVSSANYINKMSDYCKQCHYSPNKKVGAKACPFNALYWHFYDRNREQLEGNPRIGYMYSTLKRMKPEKKQAILEQADRYLEDIENL